MNDQITLPRAVVEQALEALCLWSAGHELDAVDLNNLIDRLEAALAQQAEPDHETRAELAEQQVVQLAEERNHYRRLWQKAQQAERDALLSLIVDDGFAASFQTMAQYRSALLKATKGGGNG